jgi:hypothetical protein
VGPEHRLGLTALVGPGAGGWSPLDRFGSRTKRLVIVIAEWLHGGLSIHDLRADAGPGSSFALVSYPYYNHWAARVTTATGVKSLSGRWRLRNAACAALCMCRRGRVGGNLAR